HSDIPRLCPNVNQKLVIIKVHGRYIYLKSMYKTVPTFRRVRMHTCNMRTIQLP
ncbi:unnamed protein product, partial [Ceratitis capitata]